MSDLGPDFIPPIADELPDRLKRLRKHFGLSMPAFAKRIGVSPRAYLNYERGERELPLSGFKGVVLAFNVDIAWLLLGEDRGAVLPKTVERVMPKDTSKQGADQ